VHEIYQLGLKHGMQLAAISGVHGVFSDEDIARVRELALAARAQAAGAAPRPAARRRAAAKKSAVVVADAAVADVPVKKVRRSRKVAAAGA